MRLVASYLGIMDLDHAALVISTVANVAAIASFVQGFIKARDQHALGTPPSKKNPLTSQKSHSWEVAQTSQKSLELTRDMVCAVIHALEKN